MLKGVLRGSFFLVHLKEVPPSESTFERSFRVCRFRCCLSFCEDVFALSGAEEADSTRGVPCVLHFPGSSLWTEISPWSQVDFTESPRMPLEIVFEDWVDNLYLKGG